jgi:uncharacterized protein
MASDVGFDRPSHPAFPASLVPIRMESGGVRLNGVAYVPSGAGPHPGVLLLHGLPGFERNLDLAQAFRLAGWTSMVVHYRGAWGSGGSFSFANVLKDARAAVEHLRSTEMRGQLRIDPDRVALVGHSMGGWASLMIGATTDVVGAASIAGFNLGAVAAAIQAETGRLDALVATFAPQMGPLAGTDARALFEEAARAGDAWDVRSRAGRYAGRPVLLLAATRDDEVPVDVHHMPMANALREVGSRLTERIVDTDHAFSDRRVELAGITTDWLASLDPGG